MASLNHTPLEPNLFELLKELKVSIQDLEKHAELYTNTLSLKRSKVSQEYLDVIHSEIKTLYHAMMMAYAYRTQLQESLQLPFEKLYEATNQLQFKMSKIKEDPSSFKDDLEHIKADLHMIENTLTQSK